MLRDPIDNHRIGASSKAKAEFEHRAEVVRARDWISQHSDIILATPHAILTAMVRTVSEVKTKGWIHDAAGEYTEPELWNVCAWFNLDWAINMGDPAQRQPVVQAFGPAARIMAHSLFCFLITHAPH